MKNLFKSVAIIATTLLVATFISCSNPSSANSNSNTDSNNTPTDTSSTSTSINLNGLNYKTTFVQMGDTEDAAKKSENAASSSDYCTLEFASSGNTFNWISTIDNAKHCDTTGTYTLNNSNISITISTSKFNFGVEKVQFNGTISEDLSKINIPVQYISDLSTYFGMTLEKQ